MGVKLFLCQKMEELEQHLESAEKFSADFINYQKTQIQKTAVISERLTKYFTWIQGGFASIMYVLGELPDIIEYIRNLEAENKDLRSQIKPQTTNTPSRMGMLTNDSYKEDIRQRNIDKSQRLDNW